MKKEEYLKEEKYQKEKRKVVSISIIVLVIGLLLGGTLIGVGVTKQFKINDDYSSSNKEKIATDLATEKTNLTTTKTKLEEKIKPVKDEIKQLERETFTGFDANYYARQDKIEELEKSISEDENSISAIEDALSDSFSSCEFGTNSYTEKYCSLKKQLDDLDDEFNKKSATFSTIPFYMFGCFVIIASCMIAGSIYVFAKRREILSFTTQQVMPVAQEGMEKMAPTVGNVAKEITKGIKDGLKDDE